MNEHFLLKLPKNLHTQVSNDIANKDYSNIQIKTIDNKPTFIYKNKHYNSIYYELPTIVEAQKTMDKKQFFKVADISNCLFVTDEHEAPTKTTLTKEEKKRMLKEALFDLKEHKTTKITKKILESSGISESLLFCKLLKFRKKNPKTLETEKRDLKVNQLLMREKMSSEIKIVYKEEDVSSLAAEIEYTLKEDDKVEIDNDISGKIEELKVIEEKIRIREEQLIGVSNVILKRRFEESLAHLKNEYDRVKYEINELKNLKDNL